MNNEPLTYLVRQKFTEKLEVCHPSDKGRPTNYYGKPFPVYTHPCNGGQGDWVRCPEGWLDEAQLYFRDGDSADHYNLLRDLLAENPPTK